jgi:hypothetical protein
VKGMKLMLMDAENPVKEPIQSLEVRLEVPNMVIRLLSKELNSRNMTMKI